MILQPLDLLTLALATLYLSYALTKTDGPFHLFATIRQRLPLGGLSKCIVCAAPWIAVVFYGLLSTPLQAIVEVFAVAGAAIVLAHYVGMAQQ